MTQFKIPFPKKIDWRKLALDFKNKDIKIIGV